jgi:hypothetical protein
MQFVKRLEKKTFKNQGRLLCTVALNIVQNKWKPILIDDVICIWGEKMKLLKQKCQAIVCKITWNNESVILLNSKPKVQVTVDNLKQFLYNKDESFLFSYKVVADILYKFMYYKIWKVFSFIFLIKQVLVYLVKLL